MNIGPLISQPAIVPFAKGFNAAIYQAGLMWGDYRSHPTGITEDATIAYTSGKVQFSPLIRAFGIEDDARSVYEDVSRRASGPIAAGLNVEPSKVRGSTLFLSQARRIKHVMGMGAKEIADFVHDPAYFEDGSLAEMNGVTSFLEFLGTRSIRQFVNMAEKSGSWPEGAVIDMKAVSKAARYIDQVANKGYASGMLTADDAAAFLLVSGLLSWSCSLCRCGGAEDAANSFLASAGCFAEAGNPLAAAIAAEVAAYLYRTEDDEGFLGRNKAFGWAAEYWFQVTEMMDRDPVGMLIGLWRGISADLMCSVTFVDGTRRNLYTSSAAFNSKFGKDAEAGADYLRLATIEAMRFTGNQTGWESLAYYLKLAIVRYGSAPGHEEMVERLEGLAVLAQNEAEALKEEITALNSWIEEKGQIAEAMWKRGMVKFRHGDFIGAMDDLRLADEMEPDMPWLLSDIGLVHHHHAHYIIHILGVEEGVQESLEIARGFLERAIESERVNEVSIPLLHARLGALHATMGDYDEAVRKLEVARDTAAKKGEISRYLAAVESARDGAAERRKAKNGSLTLVHSE